MDQREPALFRSFDCRPLVASEEAIPFRCPECGVTQFVANVLAKARYERLGSCQGCLAGHTLQQSPHLLPSFVSFWQIVGFPASPSWLERIQVVPGIPC